MGARPCGCSPSPPSCGSSTWASPTAKIFDEVYYANEGQQLLDHGVEWRTATDAAGNVTASYGDFVVHPPLGKWIIAARDQAVRRQRLGDGRRFGWRFAAAVCGSLAVLIITRIARRLFRSTVLGATAGLLMALDGLEFVLSRTAILDIFLLFFIVAAFGLPGARPGRPATALAARAGERPRPDPPGPGRPAATVLAQRPVVAAGRRGVARRGLRGQVERGLVHPAVRAADHARWESRLRKTVGARAPVAGHAARRVGLDPRRGRARRSITYLATWTGWFLTDDGWKRHYLANRAGQARVPRSSGHCRTCTTTTARCCTSTTT